MPGVSAEQIRQAKEVALLAYMKAREPHNLVRDGPNRYVLADHDSFVINNSKWRWNSRGYGCGTATALNYLIDVRGMSFVEAVRALTDERAVEIRAYQRAAAAEDQPLEKRPFRAPEPVRYANGAVGYLQRREVSAEVIGRCMRLGILYESRYFNRESQHHGAVVCVFAGKDETGTIRFAAMRGIATDMKRDKTGSDKRWSFCIPAKNPNSRHLAVFEAPIDALSHATLQQKKGWKWDGHRLSLGGTSDVALKAFLERKPQIRRVTLHLDNDRAGIIAARKIRATLAADQRYKRLRVTVNPPRGVKDYNNLLLREIQAEREEKTRIHSRQGAAFSL